MTLDKTTTIETLIKRCYDAAINKYKTCIFNPFILTDVLGMTEFQAEYYDLCNSSSKTRLEVGKHYELVKGAACSYPVFNIQGMILILEEWDKKAKRNSKYPPFPPYNIYLLESLKEIQKLNC